MATPAVLGLPIQRLAELVVHLAGERLDHRRRQPHARLAVPRGAEGIVAHQPHAIAGDVARGDLPHEQSDQRGRVQFSIGLRPVARLVTEVKNSLTIQQVQRVALDRAQFRIDTDHPWPPSCLVLSTHTIMNGGHCLR